MRIILRRRVRPDLRSQDAEYRQLALKVSRLTVGRAADRHIHIEQPDVAPKHAILFLDRGRLRVRALGAASVVVNGRSCRSASLKVGDVMTFGVSRLTLEQQRADGVLVLRLNDPNALSTARIEAADDLSLKGTGLSPHRWSWLLVLGVLALGFLAPLATALMSAVRPVVRSSPILPSDVLWQPGPVHERHRVIGNDCNKCHTTPFQRVQNEACEACHRSVHQHVPVGSADARLFTGVLCADCHLEHDAQKNLIDGHSDACTACHANLKAAAPSTELKNVKDFSKSHPDFDLTMLVPAAANAAPIGNSVQIAAAQRATAVQDSNLTFSHKVHLDPKGIDSPSGRRQLECANCHATDTGGRYMLPIRMETHCAECHTLQFDEHDPGSKVPHGDLAAVFKSLREHFSRAFLDQSLGRGPAASRRRPGDEQAVLSRDEQRRALAWADAQTTLAARELLEKRVCVQCHKVDRIAVKASDPRDWTIAPVRLTDRWFPHSLFDHAIHKTSSCETCHPRVEKSDESASIHMPTISTCRTCHGDGEPRKVASNCLTCHDFHRPGNGFFGTALSDTPVVPAR
ncbi:MAG TPA: FHA domain-containing protein [Steroidobacteraceae bacterium]|nr:FHA domain-containing protein [Steroidobacteraceae bacterium]